MSWCRALAPKSRSTMLRSDPYQMQRGRALPRAHPLRGVKSIENAKAAYRGSLKLGTAVSPWPVLDPASSRTACEGEEESRHHPHDPQRARGRPSRTPALLGTWPGQRACCWSAAPESVRTAGTLETTSPTRSQPKAELGTRCRAPRSSSKPRARRRRMKPRRPCEMKPPARLLPAQARVTVLRRGRFRV